MGFDVTAVSIIFFVAILTGGSAWLGAYWKSNESNHEATREQQARAEEIAHTNLTVTSTAYNGGQDRFTVDIENTGSAVVDVSEFTYLVDGIPVTGASVTILSAGVVGHATSDILLPGETLEVVFASVTTSPTYFKAVAENGVAAYWGSA